MRQASYNYNKIKSLEFYAADRSHRVVLTDKFFIHKSLFIAAKKELFLLISFCARLEISSCSKTLAARRKKYSNNVASTSRHQAHVDGAKKNHKKRIQNYYLKNILEIISKKSSYSAMNLCHLSTLYQRSTNITQINAQNAHNVQSDSTRAQNLCNI